MSQFVYNSSLFKWWYHLNYQLKRCSSCKHIVYQSTPTLTLTLNLMTDANPLLMQSSPFYNPFIVVHHLKHVPTGNTSRDLLNVENLISDFSKIISYVRNI